MIIYVIEEQNILLNILISSLSSIKSDVFDYFNSIFAILIIETINTYSLMIVFKLDLFLSEIILAKLMSILEDIEIIIQQL